MKDENNYKNYDNVCPKKLFFSSQSTLFKHNVIYNN